MEFGWKKPWRGIRREEKKGTVTVKAADTGETLFSSSFDIPANGRTVVGEIPAREGQGMWLIEAVIGEAQLANHYLTGRPPFKLDDYERWYKKLEIRKD